MLRTSYLQMSTKVVIPVYGYILDTRIYGDFRRIRVHTEHIYIRTYE